MQTHLQTTASLHFGIILILNLLFKWHECNYYFKLILKFSGQKLAFFFLALFSLPFATVSKIIVYLIILLLLTILFLSFISYLTIPLINFCEGYLKIENRVAFKKNLMNSMLTSKTNFSVCLTH